MMESLVAMALWAASTHPDPALVASADRVVVAKEASEQEDNSAQHFPYN